MKTPEEVEKLKQNWLKDPIWDIWKTEGFEEYADELQKYQLNIENEQADKHQKHLDELAKQLCPMSKARHYKDMIYSNHCVLDKCAWWNKTKECCSVVFLAHLEDIASASRVYAYKNEDR